MKSNLILPPYLVPYKDAMYQDHFDLNYIRLEAGRAKSRPVPDKPIVDKPSAIEHLDLDTKAIDTTTDADSIKKKEPVAENGWFGEW